MWQEFVPFLEFPPELRKGVYTTNAIGSLNARFRRNDVLNYITPYATIAPFAASTFSASYA